MTQPHFHLITPSYNQARFIPETLESVLSQTGVKVTLWVMDGGSKDGTVALLKKYSKRINWVSQQDAGQSDALNQGLKKVLHKVSKSQYHQTYVSYLNSDDFLSPGALKRVAEVFTSNSSATWLVGECQIVNEESQPIQRLTQLYKKCWRQFLSWPVLLILNPLPQPAVFWRLSCTSEIGFFTQKLHYTMDYEYWLRLWQRFGPPTVIHDQLAHFRIHGASKGSISFVKQFDEQYQVATHFSRSPLLLGLQRLHNQAICFVYNSIKK